MFTEEKIKELLDFSLYDNGIKIDSINIDYEKIIKGYNNSALRQMLTRTCQYPEWMIKQYNDLGIGDLLSQTSDSPDNIDTFVEMVILYKSIILELGCQNPNPAWLSLENAQNIAVSAVLKGLDSNESISRKVGYSQITVEKFDPIYLEDFIKYNKDYWNQIKKSITNIPLYDVDMMIYKFFRIYKDLFEKINSNSNYNKKDEFHLKVVEDPSIKEEVNAVPGPAIVVSPSELKRIRNDKMPLEEWQEIEAHAKEFKDNNLTNNSKVKAIGKRKPNKEQ